MHKRLLGKLLVLRAKVSDYKATGIANDFHLGFGICSNAVLRDDDITIELTYIFTRWPKYSGNPKYPIKAPNSQDSERGIYAWAVDYDKMWLGSYGDLRIELLDFCIDELTLKANNVS